MRPLPCRNMARQADSRVCPRTRPCWQYRLPMTKTRRRQLRPGAISAGDLSPRDQRDLVALRRRRAPIGRRHRGRRHPGPRPHGPRQPAAGGQHRPRLYRQGPGPAGPDRGRQPRPAARGRGLRSGRRHPLLHLRQLLDQAVDQAGADQHGQDDPHSRLHGRAAVEVAAGEHAAGRGTGPHAHAGRNRPRAGPAAEKAADHQEGHPHLQPHAADRPGRGRLVAGRNGHGRADPQPGRASWSKATTSPT